MILLKKFKLVVTLYIFLGLTLGITGVLISLLSNAGMFFSDNTLLRLTSLFLGALLLVVGSHLVIAGVSSLRSTS